MQAFGHGSPSAAPAVLPALQHITWLPMLPSMACVSGLPMHTPARLHDLAVTYACATLPLRRSEQAEGEAKAKAQARDKAETQLAALQQDMLKASAALAGRYKACVAALPASVQAMVPGAEADEVPSGSLLELVLERLEQDRGELNQVGGRRQRLATLPGLGVTVAGLLCALPSGQGCAECHGWLPCRVSHVHVVHGIRWCLVSAS